MQNRCINTGLGRGKPFLSGAGSKATLIKSTAGMPHA